MDCRGTWVSWLALLMGAFWANSATTAAESSGRLEEWKNESAGQTPPASRSHSSPPARTHSSDLPLEQIPGKVGQRVQQVVEQPTLATFGQAEVFPGDPALYY